MIKRFGDFVNEEYFDMQTLGIERNLMPQIAQEDLNDFWLFLDSEGVSYSTNQTEDISKLRPSQSEYNASKVGVLKGDDYDKVKKIPLLVSKDNYVLDGHHRYMSLFLTQGTIRGIVRAKIHRVNLSAVDFLNVAKRFPKTFYKSIDEGTATDRWEEISNIVKTMFAFLAVDKNKKKKEKEKVNEEGEGGVTSVTTAIPHSQKDAVVDKKKKKAPLIKQVGPTVV